MVSFNVGVYMVNHKSCTGKSRIKMMFLSVFQNLYLTRLHSAILAVLLDKNFVLLDNSYHKNRNVYVTWLKDLDFAQFQNSL